MITWEQNSMLLRFFGCKYELQSTFGDGCRYFRRNQVQQGVITMCLLKQKSFKKT